jgi:HD superfamily phosphohydrolase
MIIRDPIYGRFATPEYLDRLILAPEVRRLMGVRLLNTPSPSLPTLSEIRRFSHTLGVLHLVLTNPHLGLDKNELRALAAAVLIHDAATPPLAHLLEYYLKDRTGWNHETALPDMLTGHHALENVAHQILPGEEMKFKRLCLSNRIDFELVLKIVRNEHPASGLLFGTLDFDNLDNVVRMAWALGFSPDPAPFLAIARELSVSFDGKLRLPIHLVPAVEVWAAIRKSVYHVLVFDELTVASQAVLTKAIRRLFDKRQPDDINWVKRDSDLLELLTRSAETKELMLRHFYESLPRQILGVRIEGSLRNLGFTSRDQAMDFVEDIAQGELQVKAPFGYVFVDKGTFAKKLDFIDPATGTHWTLGNTTESVIFYCFANESGKSAARLLNAFKDAVLRVLGKPAATNDVDAPKTNTRLTG